ncbi:family 16 glycosylhydrolase [Loktanella sp. S4079]|uniref:family 16 glycosylhydrolase n=1 Tax=Loktanella sp. S4079 TaxID=579483 RepID=UPI0006960D87|nr:family 16 glycosylhydrolase [Loktanella sp. S4079]
MIFSRSISNFPTIGIASLLALCASTADAQRQRQFGEPFMTAFPFAGLGSQWWVAQYDHPADWFQTGWRASAIDLNATGIGFSLDPTDPENIVEASVLEGDDGTLMNTGLTSKPFTSGQVQRRKWYGYGRYEVIMQPAVGEGLISAFYLYTGPYFGDTHEEIDIEFLGRDTSKIYLNRYRDGQQLEEPSWTDLGFDASEKPRLYAFEWSEDALVWYAEDQEIFRLDGADQIPRPPAKIYMDLWAGGPGQADWAGEATPDSAGHAIIQCASFSPADQDTAQCSDLAAKE